MYKRQGNRFAARSFTDVLYGVLFVMKQLELHPAHVPVYVFGEIAEGDALHQALYPYVADLRVGLPERLQPLALPENAAAFHPYATLLYPFENIPA